MIISTDRQPAQLNSKKYKVVEIDGERYYAHRVKAGIRTKNSKSGYKSKTIVDHQDNDSKNNSRTNLGKITRGANVGKSNRRRKGKKKRR